VVMVRLDVSRWLWGHWVEEGGRDKTVGVRR
jgi:hypothetical protein